MHFTPTTPGCIKQQQAANKKLLIRVTLLAAFLTFMNVTVWASPQAAITLSVKKEKLKKVLRLIEEQTAYHFLYMDNPVIDSKKVTVTVNESPLEPLLNTLLEGTGLIYKINAKNLITLSAIPAGESKPVIIATTVKGKITDEKGAALAGVSVTVKGTQRGTNTDATGMFSIEANPGDVLEFSMLGYTAAIQKVGAETMYTIQLVSETANLGDVVVVGYGTQKRKNITGAVSTVTSADFGNQPVTSAANALSGRVTGVQIVQGSGQPGKDAPVIQIRGVGTIRTSIDAQNADSGPLILVDGIQSTMDDINPNDIESFTVLKDASSAAIYGARAANGVILITTKRGTNKGPRINYNVYQAFQSATNTPKMLGLYDFMVLKNEAQTNTGRAILYSDALLQTVKNGTDPRFAKPYYSYFDDGYRKNAPLTNHYLSVTGGNNTVKYMISGGYQDQEGIVIETHGKRYNFRSNIDVTINKQIRAGLNISGSYSNYYEPNYQGLGVTQFIRDMIRMPTTVLEDYGNGFVGLGNAALTAAQNANFVNPIGMAKNGGLDITRTYRATPNIYLEFEPIRDLVFKANASVFYDDTKKDRMQAKVNVSNGVNATTTNGLGQLINSDETALTNTFELTGRYTKKIKASTVNVLAGLTRQTYRDDFFNASNQGYNGTILTQLNAGTLTPSVSGVATEWALASLFGRVSYDYAGKYLAEFNIRHDGSSRFGANNRYGNFPSVSLGWNIAKENFLINNRNINELKLRASWGQLGNQNIGNYASISTLSLQQPYVFGNALVPGAAATQMANPDVKWETSSSTDIGIDAALFDNAFKFTADYYSRVSTDLLLTPPIAASLGNLSPPVQNAGEVKNSGYELTATYNGKIGNDFTYFVSANWTHNDNKVLKLDSKFISANKVITQEGSPINSFYGYRILGIFQTDADAQNAGKYGKQPGGLSTRAGDYIYDDVNHDGVVNTDDRLIIGDPNIHNTYGFSFGFNYKGFDFRTLFQGVKGRVIENGVYGTDGLRGLNNASAEYLNRWTPSNPTSTITRVATGYNYNTSLFVGPTISAQLLDGSYLRMRSIELGYNLPASLIEKLHINKARFYVAGQNLLTFTKFPKNYDPEDAATFNNTNDSYPQAKTFSVGINLTF